MRECRSIWSGASGLPYYCAPLVCVSAALDSLAVWRQNKLKTKSCVAALQTKNKKPGRGLGLCLFFSSALVCDLLPRRLLHGFAKGALPEEYLSHNFDEQCLGPG